MTEATHARLTSRNGGQAVFDGMRVDGRVHGMLLDITATQTFRNPGSAHIELVYSFPLPADAVLLAMTVRLGERRLTGTVVEKILAAGRYEDSLAEGDSAVMLEKTHDGSYCLNIGNLAPGETGEIVLRYAQTLAFAGDGLRICVPTVIAPRYGDPQVDAGLAPHQAPEPDLCAEYPFGLILELAPAFAGAAIASPSHRIGVRAHAGGVTVRLAGAAALDRDFLLTLEGLAHDSTATAAPDPLTPGQTAVLAGFRPRMARLDAKPVRARILVDCSGSMAGDSIGAARKALQAIVKGFDTDDRFSLSRFGDTVEHRSHALWKSTDVTRLSASRWIGDLQADLGGTEMAAALVSTMALDPAAGGDVLLVTDGQIHAIDAVIDAARASKCRLFIVAIGSSPAEGHLRRLARATRGAIDFVAPGEGVAAAVGRMFARLRSPRMDALRLAWASGRTATWTGLPDTVFADDTVHAAALADGEIEDDELRLYGRDALGREHEIGRAAVTAKQDDGALARLAVHARLHGDDAPGIAEHRRLACAYSLVTEHTSFLLTLERAAGEKALQMPQLRHVGQMLPAGWAGAGSVHAGDGLGMRQPAVWRREAASDAILAAMRATDNDLPAFLRRSDDGERAPKRSLAQLMAGLWHHETESVYLTPLVLQQMLSSTPHALWDRSYDDLLAAKIDPALVAWLRDTFGGTHPEDEVVASFLHCMAQAALTFANRIGLARRVSLPAQADAALAARIADALAGMTADAWPALPPAPDTQDEAARAAA
ncbi:VIT domain-containing protein [Massilia sp. Leaf139]|uniref:VIT domain-containing protein n=1 Tax=Massilia sp. Leaf139 TaxID=1736272 RepID=UPI0006F4CE90|nr:VIT domain-containing protein [Massilia sp. Leaf139]KQQ86621.1 hypothetical protein ASF77_20185 [Massilia sp. Leaf139]